MGGFERADPAGRRRLRPPPLRPPCRSCAPLAANPFPPTESCSSLARPRLSTNGPHHFGVAGMELDGSPLSAEHSLALPHSIAVLLHYESCTYAGWRTKFMQMAREDQVGASPAAPEESARIQCVTISLHRRPLLRSLHVALRLSSSSLSLRAKASASRPTITSQLRRQPRSTPWPTPREP